MGRFVVCSRGEVEDLGGGLYLSRSGTFPAGPRFAGSGALVPTTWRNRRRKTGHDGNAVAYEELHCETELQRLESLSTASFHALIQFSARPTCVAVCAACTPYWVLHQHWRLDAQRAFVSLS